MTLAQPKVIVLTGYGINCEEETAAAFRLAGARAQIVHVNDLIDAPRRLADYQVLSFPGGFSYGDDTGSGNALASRMRSNLWDELLTFVHADKLVLGICNGFQVMTNLGLLPALRGDYGRRQAALMHNDTARYECRWVELVVEPGPCVFARGMTTIRVPVAHGEGKFYTTADVLDELRRQGQVVFRYSKDGAPAGGEFPYNPNGALHDIAGICDGSGRLLGMMPHPERNIAFTQRDDWTRLKEECRRHGGKLARESDGLRIFKNAVGYFQ